MSNKIPDLSGVDVLVVLSAGTVERQTEHGKEFVSTTYDDRDKFGVLGGLARLKAAFVLSKRLPSTMVMTTSQRLEGDQPTHASILARELREMGLEGSRVILEERSKTTTGQVLEALKLSRERGFKKIALITNEYHIPRVRAMVENLGKVIKEDITDLIAWLTTVEVMFVCAEDVLLESDPDFEALFNQAKATQAYADRLAAEAKGVSDILGGTYGNVAVDPRDKRERAA